MTIQMVEATPSAAYELSSNHGVFRPMPPTTRPFRAHDERRREVRHAINGSAHLIGPGKTHNVDLIDLSRSGALVSQPRLAQLFVGDEFKVAGSAMPWERGARVVAISHRGVHLAFHAN
jgi:hypothetical protein